MVDNATTGKAKGRGFWKAAARIGAAALLAAALASLAASALRMHRAFLRRDTLAEARNWTFSRFPDDAALAFDEYVGPVSRGVPCHPVFVQRLPEFWPATRRGKEPDAEPGSIAFYFRNASFPGRLGNRHPATRALLPPFASNVTAFARDNVLVASWKPAGAGAQPVFAQHDVELWALCGPRGDGASPWRPAPEPGAPVVDFEFPRPICLVENEHAFRGALLADAPLGAIDGLKIVGKRREMQPPPDAALAVFLHARGAAPATIRAEGRILRAERRLAPGEWAVLPLDRAAFARAARTDPFPGFRVRMRGDDQTSLCIGFFARDNAEARRLLRAAGAGLPPLIGDEGIRAAEASIAAWRAGTGPEPRFGCGLPVSFALALARLRLPPFHARPEHRLPVWLPPGTWTVDVEFPPDLAPPDAETRLFVGQISPFRPVETADGRAVHTAEVRSGRGLLLEIDPDFAPGPALLASGLLGAEIRWSALPCRFW